MSLFVLIFVVVALVAVCVAAVQIYNSLVSLRAQVERAWSNIDVVLRQRYDEIPQIIKVVEQYAGYEGDVVKHLAEARARYGAAREVGEKIDAAQQMSVAMQGVAAILEAYPDLKANQSFLQLQTRVSALEDTIADRREVYNETVANFNTRIEQFPDLLAARMLGYERQRLYEATEAERGLPGLAMNMPNLGRSA